MFKGTVSVICDLPFIEWHVRFTTIPFKPLLGQGLRWYSYLEIKCQETVRVYTVTSSTQSSAVQMRQWLNCKNAWEVGKDFLQVLHLICDTCTKVDSCATC